MRPPGTPAQLERRRRHAIRLLKAGKSLSAVARAVSASVSSVSRWWQAYRRAGPKGLRPKPTPGRPPRLSRTQARALVRWLGQGARAAGYATELWTLHRVATLIRRRFRIRYHPCHVWRILTGLGWSCQRPTRRARERDEAAIARWKRRTWPRIKKGPRTWAPTSSS